MSRAAHVAPQPASPVSHLVVSRCASHRKFDFGVFRSFCPPFCGRTIRLSFKCTCTVVGSMLNRANLVGFWRLFVRRLTGVGSFLYQRFKRRTPHGKVGPNCPNCSTETGSTHTGSTSVGGRWPAVWSTQSACSCSTHQAHPCACPRGRGRKLVAIQTEARACQPRNCPFCHAAPRVGCTL